MPTASAVQECGAVIVGAGPGGYTAAMALAKNGFKDVRVLERAPSADAYNPSKAFVYALFPAGKNALRHLGMNDVDHIGLSGNGMDMTTVAPDGSFKRSRVFAKPEEAFSVRTATTWLPRDGLNAALYQHVCDHYGDAVTVEFSTKVVDIMIPQAPGQPLGVVTAPCGEGGAASEQRQLHCKLMVGADGANSRVREALQRAQPGQGWDREEKPSASSGLHFRVLPLPPCPKLCDSAGVLQNTQAAAFAGTPVNGDAPLRLGLLPIKDNTRPRTANFILWPEHNFWKITEPAALYSYLQQAFPQVQYWRDLVPEAEAKRFLSTEPGRFSHPQACGRLLARFEDAQAVATGEGDAAASIQGSAVMLLGDAAHVFPPDLGQGVNSAILDVFTLSTSLERHRGDSGAALVEYESVRLPESKALVDIMVFGWPWQYKQQGVAVAKFFGTVNFALRFALSKALPFAFAPPVAFQLTTGDFEDPAAYDSLYRDCLERSRRTTAAMTALGVVVLAIGTRAVGVW